MLYAIKIKSKVKLMLGLKGHTGCGSRTGGDR